VLARAGRITEEIQRRCTLPAEVDPIRLLLRETPMERLNGLAVYRTLSDLDRHCVERRFS